MFFFQRDLCSKRGLIPETDQQTFQMSLPRKLKSKYDRIIMPVLIAQVRVLTYSLNCPTAYT